MQAIVHWIRRLGALLARTLSTRTGLRHTAIAALSVTLGGALAGCIGSHGGSANYSYNGAAACNDSSTYVGQSASNAANSSDANAKALSAKTDSTGSNLTIHYHRQDNSYSTWKLYYQTSTSASDTAASAASASFVEATASATAATSDSSYGTSYWENYTIPTAGLTGAKTILFYFAQPAVKASTGVTATAAVYDIGTLEASIRTGALPSGTEIWAWNNDNSFMSAYPASLTTLKVHFKTYADSYNLWGLSLNAASAADATADFNATELAKLTADSTLVTLPDMPNWAAPTDAYGGTFTISITAPTAGVMPGGIELIFTTLTSAGTSAGSTLPIFVDFSKLTVSGDSAEVWVRQDSSSPFYTASASAYSGAVSTTNAQAYWMTKNTLLWPGVATQPKASFQLYYSAKGTIKATRQGTQYVISGADGSVPLTSLSDSAASAVIASSITAQRINSFANPGVILSLNSGTVATTAGSAGLSLIQQQLVLVQSVPASSAAASASSALQVNNVTTAQPAGALDDAYALAASAALASQSATLGLSFSAGVPTFALWAPTAQKVSLCVYTSGESGATGTAYAMTRSASTGIWSYTGTADMAHLYYKYAVDVFVRNAGRVAHNLVTDPYSVSTSANGFRSFIADLADDSSVQPSNWSADSTPGTVSSPSDMSLYQLHIREFSSNDATVPSAHRGKFLAFTDTNSNGMKHLAELAKAGLTDVLLMPANDFASVPEVGCITPNVNNSGSDSEIEQTTVSNTQTVDCYNAGFDTEYFGSPEGSYSSDATQGAKRILEFRQMVQALHSAGLRVGMTLNLSGTALAGQTPQDALDQIVPDYYHRQDASGNYEAYSGHYDTASENMMMDQLLQDSVKRWRVHYHVDSFRLVNSGLITMKALQDVYNAAQPSESTPSIFFVADGNTITSSYPLQGLSTATTLNVLEGAAATTTTVESASGTTTTISNPESGTVVPVTLGTLPTPTIGLFGQLGFNALRGGATTDTLTALVTNQGYLNGYGYATNATCAALSTCATAQGSSASASAVQAKVAVALQGSLLLMSNNFGTAFDPNESVNSVGDYDTHTLFDINALRLPTTTTADDRARVQALGIAINALSQGTAFFYAGVETLRSKSLDQDSVDSGDWFNKLDWTYSSNNYGVGLPLLSVNGGNWSIYRPCLTTYQGAITPTSTQINYVRQYFDDMLAIRKSSALFRHAGTDAKSTTVDTTASTTTIITTNSIATPNTAILPEKTNGATAYDNALLVEDITGGTDTYSEAVIIVNPDTTAKVFTDSTLAGKSLTLHPRLAAQTGAYQDWTQTALATYTSSTGKFTVPAHSTIVWVVAK